MIADIIVIAVVAVCILLGYRSGFLKTLINVVSYIASIILSFLFYPVLSGFLMKTPIHTFFVEKIGEKYRTADIIHTEWQFFENYINSAEGAVSTAIAELLINIISFILIVIICKIAIRLIGNALNLFARLPVIKQFNRLGGAVTGGLLGILVVYIVMALMVAFVPLDSLDGVTEEIQKSVFAEEMYNNNIILNLIYGEE